VIYCDACGARLQSGPDDGGAYQTLCNDCGCDLCSSCAARFSAEGGYGDDGSQVRVSALCHSCWADQVTAVEPATDEHEVGGQDRDEARALRHEGDE
jgi:hypothetical protein